jgi:hypothetical protein
LLADLSAVAAAQAGTADLRKFTKGFYYKARFAKARQLGLHRYKNNTAGFLFL